MEVFLYGQANVQPFKTTKWPSPQENAGFNLSKCIEAAIKNYLESLGGECPANVYWQALKEMERPLFEAILKETKNNHTKAAKLLGISRGGFRIKLKAHGLMIQGKNNNVE